MPTDDIDDGLTPEERAALLEGEEEDLEPKDPEDGNTDPEDPKDDPEEPEGTPKEPEDPPADPPKASEPASRDDGKPAPVFVAEAPADAEAKLKELSTQKEDLISKFDDGELTAKEYQLQIDALNKQEREIERAIERAQLAAEMEQQRQRNEWFSTVNSFIAANPIYNQETNPRLYRALDQEVRDIAATDEGKSMTGQAILAKAHENLMKEFNLAPAAPGKQGKQQRPSAPPSLHAVPAADANDVTGGRYAALDRMAMTNPIAYEEALAKLSDDERNAYLASA